MQKIVDFLKVCVIIVIVNKKTYQTTVELELPVEGVITNGTTNQEITDLEDIVFKII